MDDDGVNRRLIVILLSEPSIRRWSVRLASIPTVCLASKFCKSCMRAVKRGTSIIIVVQRLCMTEYRGLPGSPDQTAPEMCCYLQLLKLTDTG